METKRQSFLVRVAMTLLLTVLTTVTAWADTWPAYITDVVLAGGTETEAQSVKNSTAYSGYTWCSTSLNDGTSGDVIYIGYKKSSSPAYINGGYITDFIIIDAGTGTEGHNPPYSLTFQGRTYYRCPAAGGDYFVNSNHGNLTSQASKGWNMYLYYTKANFSDKRAVDGISIYSVGDINEHKSGAIDCYYKDGTLHEKEISLNKGVSNTPYVYMHINTVTKTNRPSTDPVMASGLVYNGSALQLIKTEATLASGTMYYRLGTSGEWTSNVADIKATTQGYYTVYYYASSTSYCNQSVISESHAKTVTIAKSPNNGVTVSCSNYLEGTTPVPSLVGNNLSKGAITYSYSPSQNGTYTTTVPVEPGTYWVKATVYGDDNCYDYTTAPVSFTITYDWALHNSGDTEADAYVISTTSDLNLLAQRVNGGNSYSGKCFRLGGNITYSHTSVWDNTTSTENNYTPIGNNNENKFKGHFDGKEYTVSGIRISASNYYNGLFGNLDGATVKNVILSDARIMSTAQYCGGIAGYGSSSTITNCWVKSNVCVGKNNYVGGIVGEIVTGTIMGCRSEAMLKDDSNNRERYGGIAGTVQGQANVKHCIVVGASVPNTNYHGAIVGRWIGNNTNNYYINCTVAGVADATNVGSEGSDRKGARKAVAINTADGVTVTPTGTAITYNVSGITAYEGNNGILYGGKLYAGATEQVRLTVGYNVPADYALNGYTDGHDNALTANDDDTYTLTMTDEAATVTPDGVSLWGTASGADGSQAHPYVITTPAGLDLLAQKVNGGNKYQYSYFVLGDDIAYDKTALTLDLDNDGNNDSNYMPVGKNGSPFMGNFDGHGHTISGIRVNANGMYRIGVFGVNDGTVKNLMVSDCLFAGDGYVGAIAGMNRGTVENCHVAADVSVIGNNIVGGVVGDNGGSVLGCTSAATLSAKEYARYFGGIAGGNSGTLTDNLFTGTIDGMPVGSWDIGAITGYNDTELGGTLTNNYHTCSGMGSVGNDNDATNTDQDGAQLAYEFPTANGAMGNTGSTYGTGDYTGITAYEHGLAYNGKYYCPSLWGGSGTADDPYIIVNTQGLDKLATNVNGGTGYSKKFFVLGNDIVYDKTVLTLDLDNDGENDSNYMPVGNNDASFYGNFDGQGHTISGILVNTNYIGVFGFNDGTVKNLTVSDCLFAGRETIGAIAGYNRGTVENCHVAAYVSVTGNNTVGGVVGDNEGSVLGCTSAAALSAKEYAAYFGGIAGGNTGTLTDNLFTGTIGKMPDGPNNISIGAITGNNNTDYGTLTNNFHTCSGMGGVGNMDDATNTDQDGAQFAYEFPTANGAMGNTGNTYGTGGYTGITAYEHGLAYNGKFYSPSPWGGSGTAEDPYIIVNTQGMDKLATNVNGGNGYHDTYFVLGNDIVYDKTVLTLDLDNDGENDSNYMPVGKNGSSFYGNFDGQGHTISGILVNTNGMDYIGVFGFNDGTVKNLTVRDCLFAGRETIGAIAGYNRGTVENCHVAAYVSVTGNNGVGGVVGENEGFVLGCTSAATLSAKEYAAYFGGIAGRNTGTLTDNLFTGTIGEMPDVSWGIGAITGYHDTELGGTLTNNFHTCSGMGGVGNMDDATNTDQDGAQLAYEFPTANGAMGNTGSTYGTGDYTGITAYEHGLAYNGKFYSPSPWGGSGTAEDPYIIVNTQGMDLLATNVNGGNYYQYTYFVLGNDIAYDANALTLDLDGDGNNDSNYMPVGNNGSPFMGNFDGQGHTIKGIRVNANGMNYIGVFGINDGTVKNLTVSGCLFAGSMDVGAIAGLNRGTVENCHVVAGVSVTGESSVGGVVGDNEGSVLGCTSAAALSAKESADYFGGIAGSNVGTLTDNLFTGTIGEMPDSHFNSGIGAITGYYDTESGGTLTNNFHTCSGMGGVGNDNDATNTDQDGAQFAVARSTQPDASIIGEEKKTYGGTEYTGITAYEHGLYYNGKYYYWSEDIVVPGDANGDGVVTISDAVAIVNYILGKAPAGFNEAAADMNGDGKVTITDAVMLVNMIGSQP